MQFVATFVDSSIFPSCEAQDSRKKRDADANANPTIEESSGKIDMLLNPNKAVQRILDKERTMEDIRDKQNIVQNIVLCLDFDYTE